MTPEKMSDPSAQLASAEALLRDCNLRSAGSAMLIAVAQVRVMIAQALIALEANGPARVTVEEEGPVRVTPGERRGMQEMIGGQPAEPERLDPAITELLDRAADMLGEAEPARRTTRWEEQAEKWMNDWRAYLHATYHRRQPW